MFSRSVITCLRLMVFLPTIGVLSGTQPGYTQVTLPTDFISPNVPHDVPAGSTASIQELAIFAWQEFIALNWVAMDPATTMTRGRPDLNADFLSIQPDSDGNFPLVVWHTYQHKNEVFPGSGATLPNFDTNKPTYDYIMQPTPANESASFDLFNNLDETSEIGLAVMYSHYVTSTNNIRVAYEAKANRSVFNYLNHNGPPDASGNSTCLTPSRSGCFTACPGQSCNTLNQAKSKTTGVPGLAQYGGICVPTVVPSTPGKEELSTDPSIISLPCGDAAVAGDDGEGAIEIKAAWRKLTSEELSSSPPRFYTHNVIYYTTGPNGPVYNNEIYGLVALHIIHKTKSFPAFVFATFEQVDNYDDASNTNPQDLAYVDLPASTPPTPVSVTRNHPIHSQIPPVNDAVSTAFKAQDPLTVWQFYKLIGVQATPVSGPPAAPTDPSPPPSETDISSYYFLANLLVETNQTLQNFFGSLNGTVPMASKNVYLNGASGSPFQMGGCQGCHGAAGQSVGGDMSVIIGVAPYTSNTVPDPIDADLATSFLLAQKKLYDLPKPVISEPPPESEPPPSHHHGHHNHRPDH
jgi:hypothetical protein